MHSITTSEQVHRDTQLKRVLTGSAARRNLTARTAVASLALATATIPVTAGNGSEIVTKEDPNAIRPFHVQKNFARRSNHFVATRERR